MRTLRRLGLLICFWTFALMMLGGYVKAIHAGLACPDWPKCWGTWLPPWDHSDDFTTHQVAAEWIHRAVAAGLGPFLLAFAFLAWRQKDAHPVVRYTPAAAIGVLGVQAVLGGLTVLRLLEPLIVVSHLGMATVFLVMIVVTTVMLYVHPYRTPTLPVGAGGAGGTGGGVAEPATTNRAVTHSTTPDPMPARRADGVWREPVPASAAAAEVPVRRGLRAVVADYVSMTKPRVMFLLVLTSVTAMFIAASGVPPFWPAIGVVLGGAMATGGSGAINHFFERDLDQQMERTRNRPVASGRVSPGAALSFGVTLGILSFVVTWHLANLLAAFFAACGLLFYVFIYTLWLKRATYLNIVIGGAAGGFPALVGWAAVADSVGVAAWLFFLLIVMWTPPHFWALALVLKDDYGRAGVPMLPTVKGIPRTTREILVYSVVTVALSFGFYFLDVLGRVYLISAAALGGLFLVLALQLHQEPTKRSARALFGYSILYLGLLYTAAFVDVALF